MRQLGVALLGLTLAGCIHSSPADPASGAGALVTFDPAMEIVDARDTQRPFVYSAPADDEPSADQQWSLLGREDRAAAIPANDYTPRACPPLDAGGVSGRDAVLAAIAARAADHRIVVINESHSNTVHRAFTADLLERLEPLGFTVFAAEAFANGPQAPTQLQADPALPYPPLDLGYSTMEPQFGALVRRAKALDYRLASYEQIFDADNPRQGTMEERIDRREGAQAGFIAEILAAMQPEEKLIVHVGYSHASETPQPAENGELRWMAARLEALTGENPLTISQTTCRGGAGEAVRLAGAPESIPAGTFDMLVDHSLPAFSGGRPTWQERGGMLRVPVPNALRPAEEALVIEAFYEGEPFDAVPADRVYVEPGEAIDLLLRPGHYRLRAVRPNGEPPG